jgi:hypothetical protein
MSSIQELYPVVPEYIKKYMIDYYSNSKSTFIWNGETIEEKNYYFEVELTNEQIQKFKDNFQNKSEYPYETFLNRYMLNIMEEYDKTTKQFNKNYYVVVFLIGKILPDEKIYFPNILSNDYLTATYYEIKNFNEFYIVENILPVKLTNDNEIDFSPEKVVMAENNLIFPNSTKYIKVRTQNIKIINSYPKKLPQPLAICFIKDYKTNLITSGGIAMYNINFLAQSWFDCGLSASVLNLIKTIN